MDLEKGQMPEAESYERVEKQQVTIPLWANLSWSINLLKLAGVSPLTSKIVLR